VTAAPFRIAAWSGPRNISTAMMRAFENRADTAVVDEPLYAAWLAKSGADHPMREETLTSQPQDWRVVVEALLGPVPGGRSVFYQKHMTHHVTPDMDLGWIDHLINVFLIRAPQDVLVSYAKQRPDVTFEDLGFLQQAALFDREADRLGAAPPVIDAADVLADPAGVLGALCTAVGIAFDPAMLAWPAGPRQTDGLWAPVWYAGVRRSTGFEAPRPSAPLSGLPEALRPIVDTALPIYERLARHRLAAVAPTSAASAP
jgi:hypothetical protein